jgi:hypothetical protein
MREDETPVLGPAAHIEDEIKLIFRPQKVYWLVGSHIAADMWQLVVAVENSHT